MELISPALPFRNLLDEPNELLSAREVGRRRPTDFSERENSVEKAQ